MTVIFHLLIIIQKSEEVVVARWVTFLNPHLSPPQESTQHVAQFVYDFCGACLNVSLGCDTWFTWNGRGAEKKKCACVCRRLCRYARKLHCCGQQVELPEGLLIILGCEVYVLKGTRMKNSTTLWSVLLGITQKKLSLWSLRIVFILDIFRTNRVPTFSINKKSATLILWRISDGWPHGTKYVFHLGRREVTRSKWRAIKLKLSKLLSTSGGVVAEAGESFLDWIETNLY